MQIPEGSGEVKNQWGKLIISALFLSVALTAFDWLLGSRLLFQAADLSNHTVAQDIVRRGLNPYDIGVVALQRPGLAAGDVLYRMVWNPPICFLFPGVFFLLPGWVVYALWPGVLYLSGVALAVVGWSLSNGPLRAGAVLVAAYCSFPLMCEVYLSQISSLVALPPIIGIALFMRGRDFAAGLLMSLAVLKPHVVFLPICAIAFWTVLSRRWRVVLGGLMGVVVGAGFAELLFPGVLYWWVSREVWPVHVLGGTLSGFVRRLVLSNGGRDPVLVTLWIPLGVVLCFLLGLFKYARTPSSVAVAWSILLNFIAAPYGFVFDQTILIVVQGYLLSSCPTQARLRGTLAAVLSANGFAAFAFVGARDSEAQLWWSLYPLFLAIGFFFLLRSGRECGPRRAAAAG